MGKPTLLKIDNLSVAYKLASARVVALNHVNLSIEDGQFTVLVGETGSGKSSLGKIIIGLAGEEAETDARSKIYFNGKVITDFQALRGREIGLIAQNPLLALNPVRRCGSQILEVVKKFIPKLSRSQRREYVHQLLADCDLEDPERVYSSYPHQVSLGQLQRVNIAMALAPKPKLLIADEPFSSLDLVTKNTLIKVMVNLRKLHPFAMLLITHDLGLIGALADEWYVLKNGSIKGVGRDDFLKMDHEDPYLQSLKSNYLKLAQARTSLEHEEVAMIEVEDLSYYYRKSGWLNRRNPLAALDRCNFEVFQGEVFGIVGRSGSGKSTLAKILGGLQSSSIGSIRFRGVELSDILMEDRRTYFRKVQYILQDAGSSLPPRIKMEALFRMILKALDPGIMDEDIQGRQRELMQSVSLSPLLLDRYRHQLSGGEQQRMCIARALCAKPQVLILDESLTDLDQNIQEEVIQLLLYLNQKQNLTIILVAHDLRLIRHCCHRLLVLNSGLVDSYGSWEQVSSAGRTEYLGNLLASM